jgi:hypothetical protein
MHTNFKLGVIALTLLLPIVGCDSNETVDIPVTRFAAVLNPLNIQTGSNVTGTAAVEIAGDLMRVTVNATGLATGSTLHLQFIGSGTSCPTAANDTNGDGFIDIQEGLPAYGAFLLALDTTLTSRVVSDTSGFPTTSPIAYLERARLSAVEASMRGAPTSEFVANIPVNGDFNPAGLAVLVTGIGPIPTPSTVATLPGFTVDQSLPVACGTLSSVTTIN